MSLMYSYGTGSSASADRYSTIDDLLVQIPDNTANLIVAKDIRDSIFSLWERVSEVSIIAGSAASASVFFHNNNPTPYTVAGITAGTTFVNNTNMQDMWDKLLYPYVSPFSYVTFSNSLREYGNPIGLSSNSISLNWSVVKNTNSVTNIIVDGVPQVASGVSQSGVKTTNGTHSLSSIPSQVNIFSMSVSDGISTTTSLTTLYWSNRIYWGSVSLSSIGNPNLTMNPGSASIVSSQVTDNVILNLTGAGAGVGNELSSSKNKNYLNMNGAGKYLVFAWPTSVIGSSSPVFYVNGLINNAFTRIRTNSPFVNQYGFVGNYEVWISNTLQNSTLNIIIN